MHFDYLRLVKLSSRQRMRTTRAALFLNVPREGGTARSARRDPRLGPQCKPGESPATHPARPLPPQKERLIPPGLGGASPPGARQRGASGVGEVLTDRRLQWDRLRFVPAG